MRSDKVVIEATANGWIGRRAGLMGDTLVGETASGHDTETEQEAAEGEALLDLLAKFWPLQLGAALRRRSNEAFDEGIAFAKGGRESTAALQPEVQPAECDRNEAL